MIRHCVIVIWLILWSSSGLAQSVSRYQDSLQIPHLLRLAVQARSTHLDSALLKAQKALVLSDSYEWPLWQAKSHAILGGILSLKPAAKDITLSNEHTQKALALFRVAGDSIRVQRCLINLSNNYITLNDFPNALIFSEKALQSCLNSYRAQATSRTTKDVGLAYGTLARAYSGLDFLDSTIVNYHRAFDFLQEADSPMRFITLNNLAEMQLAHNLLDEALSNFHSALKGGKKEHLVEITIAASLGIAKVYFEQGAYQKSMKLLRTVSKSSKMGKHWDKYLEAQYLLGRTYQQFDQTDSTLYHLEQGLVVIDSVSGLEGPIRLLEFYGKVLTAQERSQEALAVLSKVQVLRDSLDIVRNFPETASQLLKKKDDQAKKHQEGYKTLLTSKTDTLKYTFMLMGVALLFVTYFSRKHLKKIRYLSRERNDMDKRIRDQIYTKELSDRKLASVQANAALQNDMLRKVNLLLGKIIEKQEANPFNKELKSTRREIQSQLALDSLWEDFFQHFDQVHPEFLSSLKNKFHLTQHELRLCAFIKMNLSHKEIARILGVNHNTINVALFRLKKKLGLPKELSTSEFLNKVLS